MVNQNDAIVVRSIVVFFSLIRPNQYHWILSLGHWFKLTERQYVDLSDFGITEEMQKPAAH